MKKFKFKIRYIFLALILFVAALFINLFVRALSVNFEKPYKKEISKQEMIQDCRRLKKYITKSYIGYYDALENGFQIDNAIESIKTKFSNDKKIDSDVFANEIFSVLTDSMKITDRNFYVLGESRYPSKNEYSLTDISYDKEKAILISPRTTSYDKILEELQLVSQNDFVIIDLQNCSTEKILRDLASKVFFPKNESMQSNCNNYIRQCWAEEDYLLNSLIVQRTFDMYREFVSPFGRADDVLKACFFFKRSYSKGSQKSFVNFPQALIKSEFTGTVIVLMNNKTALDAEYAIINLFLVNQNKVILVGENSAGQILYSGINRYFLPNSGIELGLSFIKRESSLLNTNDKFMGEGEGFVPDFICKPEEISTVISEIIKGASKNISF